MRPSQEPKGLSDPAARRSNRSASITRVGWSGASTDKTEPQFPTTVGCATSSSTNGIPVAIWDRRRSSDGFGLSAAAIPRTAPAAYRPFAPSISPTILSDAGVLRRRGARGRGTHRLVNHPMIRSAPEGNGRQAGRRPLAVIGCVTHGVGRPRPSRFTPGRSPDFRVAVPAAPRPMRPSPAPVRRRPGNLPS